MAHWNPSLHPRYPNGKFKPKFSQSVRLSPISVSYNAGVRVPVVPGRASLYVGALARVERTGRSGGVLQRHIDRAVNSVSTKLGDPGGTTNLARLLKGQDINTKSGLRVQGPQLRVAQPTFRVSSTPASREKGFEVKEVANARAPRRRARTRSATARIPSTITAGTSAKPKLAKPRKARKSSTRGRKVRR